MRTLLSYLADLFSREGSAWNRFWFAPSDPLTLCVLRILAGLAALYYHASYTFDFILWFGPRGLLAGETVQELAGDVHPSPLFFTDAEPALWVFHVVGFVVLLSFTAGLLTRVTSILSLLVILSYVHRAPMLTGLFEPVLTMLMFYLCLAPAGAYLSVDSLLGRRKSSADGPHDAGELHGCLKSSWATVATRLIQVHLTAFYLVMASNKLMSATWWQGEAVWWLIARTESRLIDLTWLHNAVYFTNGWTHAIVIFEFAFAILIWNRVARPLLLALAVLMWGSLALITGLVGFCAIMLVANLAFVSPAAMCHFGDSLRSKQGAADNEAPEKVRAEAS